MKLIACLVLVGCASAPDATVIADRVKVIDHAVTVMPDRLVAPTADDQLRDSRPGDILVSGQGAGFLRKVTSIETTSSDLTIMTEPAALTDAIVDAEYAETVHDGKWDWSGPKFSGVYLGFDSVEVQGNGGGRLDMTKGKLSFSPQLDLAMKLRGARLKQFDLVATGRFDADIGFKLHTDRASEIRYTKDLWTSPSLTFYQEVGIVPVVEVVEVVVSLEVNASTEGETDIDVAASAHSELAVGARYKDGVWRKVNDHTLVLRTEGPTITSSNNVQVQVKVPVEVHVSFYDLAGPYVSLEPYVQAEHSAGEGTKASWGTEATFGGSVNLLGAGNDSRIAGFEASLFDFNCEFGTPITECLK